MPECFRVRVAGEPCFIVVDGGAWRLLHESNHSRWGHGSPGPPHGMTAEEWRVTVKAESFVTPELGPGEHYARMWRGGAWPPPEKTPFVRAWRESVRVTRMLIAKLQAIFVSVEPVSAHAGVYSHELRMLLILACNEVESSCKEILLAHGAAPLQKNFSMLDYRKLGPPMKLARWCVRLATNPDFGPVRPFQDWDAGQPLAWYQEHHEVKHGRERHLDRATLGNTVSAVAASFILARAQFGPWADEGLSGWSAHDEFLIEAEPEWTDEERYLAPTQPGVKSPLFTAAVAKSHPALI